MTRSLVAVAVATLTLCLAPWARADQSSPSQDGTSSRGTKEPPLLLDNSAATATPATTPALPLVPTPRNADTPNGVRMKTVFGGTLIGLGIAGAASGIAMFLLDGYSYNDRYVYNTGLRLGIPLTVIGAVSFAVGIPLTVIGIRERARARLTVAPNGVAVTIQLR